MAEHHSLDIKPIPEEVLFINETALSDLTVLNDPQGKVDSDAKCVDNIRVYIPLDINANAIMRRIYDIYNRYGEVEEDNEFSVSSEVGRVISQLEIYDQIWHARGDDAGNGHSKKATDIVKEIVQYLMDNEGCAEMYPYDVIEELCSDYKLEVPE